MVFSILEPVLAGILGNLINKYIINKLNCQYCENNEDVEYIDDGERHHIPAVIFYYYFLFEQIMFNII